MNKTSQEAAVLCAHLGQSLQKKGGVEVAVCPPFTAIFAAAAALKGSEVSVGAQDVFWKPKGAFTGEISCEMLLELGCVYVIVGHSERRGRFGKPEEEFQSQLGKVFGDNDAIVNKKAVACLENGLRPIICVGENLQERQKGHTDAIVSSQLTAALKGISESGTRHLTIAYEPVWAIGTGIACEAEEAERVCSLIRNRLAAIFSREIAEELRILYGGSVTPDNTFGLMEKESIDGGLVGGASLDAGNFTRIVEETARAKRIISG
jgi:triosephosphate isomerase